MLWYSLAFHALLALVTWEGRERNLGAERKRISLWGKERESSVANFEPTLFCNEKRLSSLLNLCTCGQCVARCRAYVELTIVVSLPRPSLVNVLPDAPLSTRKVGLLYIMAFPSATLSSGDAGKSLTPISEAGDHIFFISCRFVPIELFSCLFSCFLACFLLRYQSVTKFHSIKLPTAVI